MIQNLKSSIWVLCVVTTAIVCLLAPTGAEASSASFTLPANVDTSTNGATSIGNSANGVMALASGLVSNARELINNTAGNAYGTDGDIRFILSIPMVSAYFENLSTPNYTYNGSNVVAVMALEGSVTHFPFQTILAERYQVTSGRIGIFTTSATYNGNDPMTWGATDASGTVLSKPIAVWDLKPAEPVFKITTPPLVTVVNQGVHFVNVSEDDNFLFRETQNPNFSSGAGVFSGNEFFSLTKNTVPANYVFDDEGVALRVLNQDGPTPNAGSKPWAGGPGVPAFDALNTIACQLGGLSDLDAALNGCQGFANGFAAGNASGDPRSYNPANNTTGLVNTADFDFSAFDAYLIPTEQADQVPEPASGILLSIVIAGLAAARLKRYR